MTDAKHATALAEPKVTLRIPFDNTYARLPERFHVRIEPTSVSAPVLIKLNAPLALELGLDPEALSSPTGVGMLAGNQIAPGSEPIAQAYAGHQFGHFSPQLGDGRAILLGEVVDRNGNRRDIQLKGSGPTPFSRRGDGRAALGPVLREYIVSEAFAALGIPTTRSLAAVTTGEMVARETMLPGGVLTRIAASHVRVGTFQFFAARKDLEALRVLADYVIARHYPEAGQAANPYRALLDAVMARQTSLVARWMSVGFIHGVMNTDNMTISGETIDFGPCAFMDYYDPAQVYSSIDQRGRYAYGNQPAITGWNLARFAETLIPLLAETQDVAIAEGQAAIDAFGPMFERAYRTEFARKMGFRDYREGDEQITATLLDRMAASGADFTSTFRHLNQIALPGIASGDLGERASVAIRALFETTDEHDAFMARYRERLASDPASPDERAATMRRSNPVFIPRNHLVEEAIAAAVEHGDFATFERLIEILADPFDDRPGTDRYAAPPQPHQIVHQTFCGT